MQTCHLIDAWKNLLAKFVTVDFETRFPRGIHGLFLGPYPKPSYSGIDSSSTAPAEPFRVLDVLDFHPR